MSIWKKIGKFGKKALPYASLALPFVPGVGPALSGVAGAVSRAFSGGSSPSNAEAAAGWNSKIGLDGLSGDDPNNVWSAPGVGGTQTLPRYEVTAQAPPSPGGAGFDWGGFFKGLTPALGAAGAGAANVYGMRETNQANAEMAQKQMDFQERMSNTSYQRGVKDMQAAGLNPMLGYSQGGASAPSGASAVMQNELSGGVSSAMQAAQTLQGLDLTQANIAQTRAMTEQVHAEVGRIEANTGVANAQEEELRARVRDKYPAEVAQMRQDARTSKSRELNTQTDTEYLRKTMKPRVSAAHYGAELVDYARDSAYNRSQFEKKYPEYQQNVAPFMSNALDAADLVRRFIPHGR